ncbi:DNA repair protein RecN [Desulfofustis glycolicus]|uniref:DNA repair protein RecN n=1 Tax=Desulfofustis glycolicus DSM 9705 TaxID=1121409 RepID=A0A1M5YCE9_9BACT|nr:DNA repair protein RecN [Desulfofustis glycolicus]MCB2215521.1 DNA repair protein RecN [Desulfobulbaceae bacterium]SHI09751.1 DNA replication and repair protein RecN [Desulfofustis glycolicus DSM 9705]
MLCELKVENLALIETLHLSFADASGDSLVVMTGETGAGKSIMMRAIGLLTGGRASADWIRSGADSCTVEALFEISDRQQELLELLEAGGYGGTNEIIIKRVITSKGRSRLYINGSMAPAKTVAEICLYLLNIASQHDHQQLLQPASHLDFLDTLGDHWPDRVAFTACYQHWQQAKERLAELRARDRERGQRYDFLTFQVAEIIEAALQPGEDEQLAVERRRLKSAETLIRLGRESYNLFETTISDNLAIVRRNMEQLAGLDPEASGLAEELSSYSFLAEDYSGRLRDYYTALEVDPHRLEAVSARLDQLKMLKRKYGETIEEILGYLSQAKRELESIENLDREIELQGHEVERLEQRLLKLGRALSDARRATAQQMETAMAAELGSLAFSQSGIEVHFQQQLDGVDGVRLSGLDRAEFFFAPNPGEPARPLAKVASGGELSRLMLALKCLLARKDMVETVIFDEVDAGIGGEAAEAVARKIRELAGHHQVICITHLPQIAARGTAHFVVEKSVRNGRTLSSVVQLNEEQRIDELARMLAGESVTRQTRDWATTLLEKGQTAR